MFGDTGIPLLFKEAYRLGAKKSRLKVIVAGGGQILDQNGLFNIGRRNYTVLRKLFWRNNVMTDFEDVGGNFNRILTGVSLKILIRLNEPIDFLCKVRSRNENPLFLRFKASAVTLSGSQVGNTCPFPALKAGLSPSCSP